MSSNSNVTAPTGPDPVHPTQTTPVVSAAQGPQPSHQTQPHPVSSQVTESNPPGPTTTNVTQPAPITPVSAPTPPVPAPPPVPASTPPVPAPISPVTTPTPHQAPSRSQSLSSTASNPPPNTPPKPRRPSFWSAVTEWRWEIFTWAIGTLATGIILVIFIFFKDKSLSTWKGPVQITAVIAILSQTAQSALIVSVASCIGQAALTWLKNPREKIDIEHYNEASQGPEGSLILLWLALRHPFERMRPTLQSALIYTGALTTLLMLGFGPATQQVLSIDIRGVASTTPAANIYRALQYHPVQYPIQGLAGGQDVLAGHVFPTDALLESAIASGMAANHSLSDVAAVCPSGNCAWNGYMTLGICSSVEDITFNLTASTSPLNGKSPPIFTLNTTNGVQNVVRYSYLTESSLDGSNPNGPEDFNLETLINPYFGGDGSSNHPIESPINTIADVYIVYFPTCALTNNVSGVIRNMANWDKINSNPKSWRAFHGALELCVLNLSSTVVNATTTTTSIERIDTEEPSLWDNDGVGMIFPDGNNSQAFNISWASVRSLGGMLFSIVNGSGFLDPTSNTWDSEWVLSMSRDIYGGDPFVCTPEPIGGLPAFERRLNNLALSLTNTMRTNLQGRDPVSGIMVTNDQYVNINLLWYLFPLILWAAITALLASTIVQTVFSDIPTWKASALPLLDCVDPQSADGSLKRVKQQARTQHIRLISTGSTWQLQRHP